MKFPKFISNSLKVDLRKRFRFDTSGFEHDHLFSGNVRHGSVYEEPGLDNEDNGYGFLDGLDKSPSFFDVKRLSNKELLALFVKDPVIHSTVILLISYIVGDVTVTSNLGEDAKLKKINKFLDGMGLESCLVDIVFNLIVLGHSFNHILFNGLGEPVGLDVLNEFYDEPLYLRAYDEFGGFAGWKAKLCVSDMVKDWKKLSFDEYKNLRREYKEFNFRKEEVFYVDFLSMGNLSLVGLAAEDAELYYRLKQRIPDVIRKNFEDIYVEVGTENKPFEPYSFGDSDTVKYEKKKNALEAIRKDFKRWVDKGGVITTDFLFKPHFLPPTQFSISEYVELLNHIKSDIKLSLLTPAGLFDSEAKGSAIAQIDSVFTPQVELFRNRLISCFKEQILPTIVTNPNDFEVVFDSNDTNLDEKQAQIAERLERLYPASNVEDMKVRQSLYFSDYADMSSGIEKEVVPSQYNVNMFQPPGAPVDASNPSNGGNGKEINSDKPNSTQAVNIGTGGSHKRDRNTTNQNLRNGVK